MTIRPPRFSSENSWPFNFVSSDNRSEELVPFGPVGQKMCGEGSGFIQNAALRALERVATDSKVQLTANLLPKLRLIEPLVINSYPNTVVNKLGDEQLMQLAADACLFLLVVFLMLLGPQGYSSQHILLAYGRVNKDKEKWLRSIFFVGNQIPFFMVDILMDSFESFRDCRNKLRSEGYVPPSDPLRLALFEFVTSDSQSSKPPPSDVMHCLREIILNKLIIWTGEGAPKTARSFPKEIYRYSPFPNSPPGEVTVNLPLVDINSEIWLKLIVKNLDEYETVHELQPKASEFLRGLVQSTNELFNATPCFDHNLRQRKEVQSCIPRLYFLWKYIKWLIGILIMVNAVLLILEITIHGSWLL